MANAWKNKALSGGNVLGVIGAHNRSAQAAQRAPHGGDVARAVIDQRNIHRSSFVLGSTLRNRLSRETAKRSARANALKSAST